MGVFNLGYYQRLKLVIILVLGCRKWQHGYAETFRQKLGVYRYSLLFCNIHHIQYKRRRCIELCEFGEHEHTSFEL